MGEAGYLDPGLSNRRAIQDISAIRVDGSRSVEWSARADFDWFWNLQSDGGAAWSGDRHELALWSLAEPGQTRRVQLEGDTRGLYGIGLVRIGNGQSAFLASDYSRADPPNAPVRLVLEVLCGHSAGPHETKVRVPFGGSVERIEPSPDGTRLAWSVCYSRLPPRNSALRLLFRWLHQPSGEYVGFWVSRSDGSDLREVGDTSQPAGGLAPSAVPRWGWCADSKSFWYVMDDAMWTVPAD